MHYSLVRPLSRLWALWVLSPALALAVPDRPILDRDVADPSKAAGLPGARLAAADTIWIADWSFDLPGGGCTDAGWVMYDNRILNDGTNYWSITADYSGIGGIVDHAAVLAKHDLTWARDGYGNNWDYSIILKYQGASTLTFSYLSDTEPGFDFVLVEADSLGLSESRVDYSIDPIATPSEFRVELLSVYGLQNATAGPLALTDFGAPLGIHEVYIRFTSNRDNSAEDGEYPTLYNGFVVDNIAVSGTLAYAEDFEAMPGANVTFANTAPATPFGEWARLYPHVTDNNACAENTTCAWLWSDPARLATLPDMAFGPGGAVIRNWLDDAIVSPWVSLGALTANSSTVLSYRRFPGNDYARGRIVQNWSVRSLVRIDNTDTSVPGDSIDAVMPWQHDMSWNSLTSFTWQSALGDMSGNVDPGATAIQVRFRVSDYQYIAGATPPATLDPGPGPYIDRVRIGKVTFPGPSISYPSSAWYYASQDGFPSVRTASAPGEDFAPTTDRFGTIDFTASAVDIWSGVSTPYLFNSRDSIFVDVRDDRGVGITGVGVYAAIVSGPHAGKAPPPWSVSASGFFYVPADSVRRPDGQVVPGFWSIDLDDEYFRGGDVLNYFWAATDGAGGFTSLPSGLTAAPTSIADAQQATGGLLETSYLPTIDWDPAYLARIASDPSGKLDPTPAEIANSQQRSCILYYRQQAYERRAGPAHRSAFMYTLDQLGYKDLYDVYFQTTTSGYSVHLAGRATPEQAMRYSLIVQDSGRLSVANLIPPGGLRYGAIDQQTWYRNWLTQASTSESGRATLWLVGEDFVDDAVNFGNPVVLVDMGVTLVSSSQPLLPYPNVAGQSAFTWAHGGSTNFTGDMLTLNIGCECGCLPVYNDGMGATGTAVVTHRYTLGSTVGEGAAVMNANAAASWNSMLMSFAWDDLLDVPGTPPGNRRADLMEKVLNGVLPASCSGSANPTGVPDDPAALPRLTTLHPNVPNPFNPTTTIRFDLAQSGRVKLEIFDVSGRRVRTLVDEWLAAGWGHRVTWNGLDAHGNRVASGIYLYRLVAGEAQSTRKMIVLK